MKTRKIYKEPVIEIIKLDAEISLALVSTPPDGPGEEVFLTIEYENYEHSGNSLV